MKQAYTILVVDDEPVNVLLLSKILQIHKYSVLTAGSGTEALQIMQQVIPDLVLLDLLMPRINGFEVLAHIKNSDILNTVPVIIVSALNDSENKEKAYKAGAVAYLTKPVSTKLILSIVDDILNENNSGSDYKTITELSL
jgi:CheY-like chemotaxis protein